MENWRKLQILNKKRIYELSENIVEKIDFKIFIEKQSLDNLNF